jgi:choline kinase
VIGMVLAAGAGRRLGSLTSDLPKTLLTVDGDRTILDVALSNLSAVDIRDVVVVVGFAAHRVRERAAHLESRHGVRIELVVNDRAEEWNNAYSLWVARHAFGEGVLLINGDTVHPVSVEETLLSSRGPDLLLAVDAEKPLGPEQMKVLLDGDGRLRRINKAIEPAAAHGEYIGVTLIEPSAAEPLADALEATWRRDPSLYYEDGYQELVDRGGVVGSAEIGALDWIEVDDDADLAIARELQCRS